MQLRGGLSTPVALGGCLLGLGVASAIAMNAMGSYASPTWSGKVVVEVAGPSVDGTIPLRVLSSPDDFPLEPNTPVSAATPGLPAGAAQQGTQLNCDLRVRDSASAAPIVDVVRCTPATAKG